MEPAPCLLLLLFWGHCLAGIDGEGELRCYCNESGCVSTGYMCKSSSGQCYTSVQQSQGGVTRAIHGCLDTVPLRQRKLCVRPAKKGDAGRRRENSTGEKISEFGVRETKGEGRTVSSSVPVFICCEEDMCNFFEDLEAKDVALFAKDINSSSQKGPDSLLERTIVSDTSGSDVIYTENDVKKRSGDNRDLWFKAAVIAVPIAGGFILVFLVLLAVRMLRTDTLRHRRLIQVQREHSVTKAQVYVTDHFRDVKPAMTKAETSVFGCAPGVAPRKSDTNLRRKSDTNLRRDPERGNVGYSRVGPGESRIGSGNSRIGPVDSRIGHVDSRMTSLDSRIGPLDSRIGPGDFRIGPGDSRHESGHSQDGSGYSRGGVKSACGDIDFKVDKEGRVYEKVVCDISIHRQPSPHLPSSAVRWDKQGSADLASVV